MDVKHHVYLLTSVLHIKQEDLFNPLLRAMFLFSILGLETRDDMVSVDVKHHVYFNECVLV